MFVCGCWVAVMDESRRWAVAFFWTFRPRRLGSLRFTLYIFPGCRRVVGCYSFAYTPALSVIRVP